MKEKNLFSKRRFTNKTKEELINELTEVYRRIAELEVSEAKCQEALKKTNQKLHHYQKRLKLAQEKIIQDEKLAMLYKFGSFIIHDLKNLGTSFSLAVHAFQTSPQADFLKPHIDAIIAKIENIKQIAAKFSRLPDDLELRFKRCDISSLIKDVLSKFKVPHIRVTEHLPILPPVNCDDSLQMAFYNLIENSVEAMPAGGELLISADLTKGGKYIKICISDTGCGIPEKILNNLFKPFQTTKKKGLGIGLYQCKEIIEKHKGKISLKNKSKQGTECFVLLPVAKDNPD